jgi:hypothetical protein
LRAYTNVISPTIVPEARSLIHAIASSWALAAAFAPSPPERHSNGKKVAVASLVIGSKIRYTASACPHRALRTTSREKQMAVDGNWNITMSTPMGDRDATLSLKSAGATLTGTQAAEGNSVEIFDGKVEGDDVSWKVSITNPMPLTLEFTGKVSGDSMSGEMGIGPMGSFPFTAKRA